MKWTKRFVERRRDVSPRERVSWVGLLFVLLLLAGVGFLYAYPRLTQPPISQSDFTGRVVEKFVALGESQIGSKTFLRLGVETANGARFNVAVTDDQYERARVGMWVTRTRGEIKLSWNEPESGSTTGEGKRVEAR